MLSGGFQTSFLYVNCSFEMRPGPRKASRRRSQSAHATEETLGQPLHFSDGRSETWWYHTMIHPRNWVLRCQTSFSNQPSYIFLFKYYLFLLGLSWPDLVCQAPAECARRFTPPPGVKLRIIPKLSSIEILKQAESLAVRRQCFSFSSGGLVGGGI